MKNKSKTLGLLSAFTAIAAMSSELEYSKYGRPNKRDNDDDTIRKNESIFSEEEKKSKEDGRIDGGLGKSLDLMGKLNDFLGYR